MQEFISSEITHGILEHNHVIFGMINECIMEMLDDYMSTFRTKITAMVGSRTLTFRGFHACGASKLSGKKEPLLTGNAWQMRKHFPD